MKYCPLMSYAKQYSTEVPCMGEECGFADEAGGCLVQQALQCFVAKERTQAALEDAVRQNIEASRTPTALEFMPALIDQYKNKQITIDDCFWERKE